MSDPIHSNPQPTVTSPEPVGSEPVTENPTPSAPVALEVPAEASIPVEMTPPPALQRVVKLGSTTIVLDATLAALSADHLRERLRLTYPQVAHATVREYTSGDTHILEFLPQPGRKG
jgi:hypothetical protein